MRQPYSLSFCCSCLTQDGSSKRASTLPGLVPVPKSLILECGYACVCLCTGTASFSTADVKAGRFHRYSKAWKLLVFLGSSAMLGIVWTHGAETPVRFCKRCTRSTLSFQICKCLLGIVWNARIYPSPEPSSLLSFEGSSLPKWAVEELTVVCYVR